MTRLGLAAVLACGLAAPAPALALDCSEERDLALAGLAELGLAPVIQGSLGAAGDDCVLTDLHLSDGRYLRVELGRIAWRSEGLDTVMTGVPWPLSLALQVDDARLVPQPPDATMAYLMDLQNRWNFVDARLQANIDPVQGVIDIARAAVDFPGDNGGELSLRLEGIPPLLLLGNLAGAEAISLTRLSLALENAGYLDGLAMGPLTSLLATADDDPAALVAEMKAVLTGTVEALPETVFDAATRAALVALVADGPLPRGALAVTLEPGADGVAFSRFRDIDLVSGAFDPAQMADAFGEAQIAVRYTPRAAPE